MEGTGTMHRFKNFKLKFIVMPNVKIIAKEDWLAMQIIHPADFPHTMTQLVQKANRLIFNAEDGLTMDSFPINLMTSTKSGTELNCTLRTVK